MKFLIYILNWRSVIYIIKRIIILYLGLLFQPKICKNHIPNKKNYNLVFFSGYSGYNFEKFLQNNKLFVTTYLENRRFCNHCYHFSVWQSKLPTLFYKDFLKKHTYLINPNFLFNTALILLIFHKIYKYLTNAFLFLQPTSEFRPPPECSHKFY